MSRTRSASTALLLAVALAGCSQGSALRDPTPPAGGAATSTVPPDPRSPSDVTRAIATQPLYAEGDIDPGLGPFVDQARADLAALLAVDPQAIETRAAVLVTWPDASLGCPAPDMRYASVLTDGSIIELSHAGRTYRYHAGGARGPFLCQQPMTARPPGTGSG